MTKQWDWVNVVHIITLAILSLVLVLSLMRHEPVEAKSKAAGCAEFATVYAVHISICHDDEGHVFAVDNYGMVTNLGN